MKDIRMRIQNDFMADKVPIIVCTVAFGMGIDKANGDFFI
jgi:superfamily II DNA helicase RecQ